jgi:hypothetical protein
MDSYSYTIIQEYGKLLYSMDIIKPSMKELLEKKKKIYEKQYKIYRISTMLHCVRNFFNHIFVKYKKYIESKVSCPCHQYHGLFGGFVRDWIIPCILEGIHPLCKSAPQKMLTKFPNMTIPEDIDIYAPHGMVSHFGGNFCNLLSHDMGECKQITNLFVQGYTMPVKRFDIKLPLFCKAQKWSPTFHVDITNSITNYDFSVNKWRWNINRGLFSPNMTQTMSQIYFHKEFKDFIEKKCQFVGVWNKGGSPLHKFIRKALVKRTEKMIMKGWTITNLKLKINKSIKVKQCQSFKKEQTLLACTCMICKESLLKNESIIINEENLKQIQPQQIIGHGDNIFFECCKSSFHTNCIFSWIKESCYHKSFATCPGCRKEIKLY